MNCTTHWLVFKMCFHEYEFYIFCLNYKMIARSVMVLNLKQILERIGRRKSKRTVRMEPAANLITLLPVHGPPTGSELSRGSAAKLLVLQRTHGSPKYSWFSERLLVLWRAQGSPKDSWLWEGLLAFWQAQGSLKDSWLSDGLRAPPWLCSKLKTLPWLPAPSHIHVEPVW